MHTRLWWIAGLLGMGLVVLKPHSAIALTVKEVNQIATAITVKIRVPGGESYDGSGILIARQGKTYYVLTANHVVNEQQIGGIEEGSVEVVSGKQYPFNRSAITPLSGVDLAVVKFTSNDVYPVATLSRYHYQLAERRTYNFNVETPTLQRHTPKKDKFLIFVSGWPSGEKQRVFNPGFLVDNSATAVANPLYDGYELVYTNLTKEGMSGGPVLDTSGRLIGVHGRSEGGSRELPFINEKGQAVSIRPGHSLGISTEMFLRLGAVGVPLNLLKVETSAPQPLTGGAKLEESWAPPLQMSNQEPAYWVNRGNQLWRLGNVPEALKNFDKALQLQPNFYPAWFAKGFVLGFEQRFAEALQACDRAIELESNLYAPWRCRASALHALERWPEALAALDRAIAIAESSQKRNSKEHGFTVVDWVDRGEILFALGKPTDAIAAFDKAIALKPDSAPIWNNRGFVLMQAQQYEQSLSSLSRAVQLDPGFATAWNNQGSVLRRLERLEEALAACDRAVKIDPLYATAWNNRGSILYELNRLKEAVDSFNKAIAIDPNYKAAIDNRTLVQQELRP